jgi:threonine dehydrogenase-like Zn-dependent dehydrogenase
MAAEAIPASMKQLQVLEGREFQVTTVPVPKPGPGEVLFRIEAVATCPQWDLHLRHNEPMFVGHKFHYPFMPGQPGHEATGTVEAIGEGVTTLSVGDRVSAWKDAGHAVEGCYAQYVVRPEALLIRVPANLPPEATASVELAMCVGATFLRLRSMGLVQGRKVGVMGLGPAGLIAAQLAHAEGAISVVAFDLSEQRRVYAASLGVAEPFDPRAENDGKFPARGKGRPSIDLIVDCVGAKASVEWAMDHAVESVALFGVQRETYDFQVRHYLMNLIGYPGHSREAAEYVVGLIAEGKLDLAPLNSRQLPLEQYAEGIDLLERQEAIKILFRPWQ